MELTTGALSALATHHLSYVTFEDSALMSDELWRMADRMGCHNHQERKRECQKARPEIR